MCAREGTGGSNPFLSAKCPLSQAHRAFPCAAGAWRVSSAASVSVPVFSVDTPMVLPTLAREPRQARKGATVAVSSVWWGHFQFCAGATRGELVADPRCDVLRGSRVRRFGPFPLPVAAFCPRVEPVMSDDLVIDARITVPGSALSWSAARASGKPSLMSTLLSMGLRMGLQSVMSNHPQPSAPDHPAHSTSQRAFS